MFGLDMELLADGIIEIVGVMFSPKLQRTTAATEAIFLAVRHCFETLQCHELHWYSDLTNQKSIAAALRFGFEPHGKKLDRGREYEFFTMRRDKWEAAKVEYERWLQPSNFDESGKQKSKLELKME